MKISFGCVTNDLNRMDIGLKLSEIDGIVHYVERPDSATKGLNKLLEIIEDEGADVAVLTHHDMSYRRVWLPQVREQLELLPDSWITAGIIGKDMNGLMCGKFHDTRIPAIFQTGDIHKFPERASCFDECCILVNLKKGFRFDEGLEGFDLYGTLAVLQTWEMGGSAWIIDSGAVAAKIMTPVGEIVVDITYAQHHCTRSFPWIPDERFAKNFMWLHERFPNAHMIDSTVLGVPDEKIKEVA